MSGSVIRCVGAVVTDGQGRLLMIKRGHEPGAGLWSIPGGRIEPGETDADALVREMLEETGLSVQVGRLIGRVRRPGRGGAVIDIRDYAATVTGGTLRPGDDAADARWVAAGELYSLEITEGLIEALTGWGVLGQERQLSSGFSAFCGKAFFGPAMVIVTFLVATNTHLGDPMKKPVGGRSGDRPRRHDDEVRRDAREVAHTKRVREATAEMMDRWGEVLDRPGRA